MVEDFWPIFCSLLFALHYLVVSSRLKSKQCTRRHMLRPLPTSRPSPLLEATWGHRHQNSREPYRSARGNISTAIDPGGQGWPCSPLWLLVTISNQNSYEPPAGGDCVTDHCREGVGGPLLQKQCSFTHSLPVVSRPVCPHPGTSRSQSTEGVLVNSANDIALTDRHVHAGLTGIVCHEPGPSPVCSDTDTRA